MDLLSTVHSALNCTLIQPYQPEGVYGWSNVRLKVYSLMMNAFQMVASWRMKSGLVKLFKCCP